MTRRVFLFFGFVHVAFLKIHNNLNFTKTRVTSLKNSDILFKKFKFKKTCNQLEIKDTKQKFKSFAQIDELTFSLYVFISFQYNVNINNSSLEIILDTSTEKQSRETKK
ncbi:hypothetical protein BpHYR1_047114 [Brachionus plicatilis]|uniref:Uncharacterized protein n=1 Tax=Brachionus plicatilis TaxID=10195 RepID=A0A3M7Q192_BRAPC|nr:hypothetical protein BpHYR1_047114 [Brachionus plicatilis]